MDELIETATPVTIFVERENQEISRNLMQLFFSFFFFNIRES